MAVHRKDATSAPASAHSTLTLIMRPPHLAVPTTCPAGTSLVGTNCTLCPGIATSPGGATSVAVCKACAAGQVANANKTSCGEGDGALANGAQ